MKPSIRSSNLVHENLVPSASFNRIRKALLWCTTAIALLQIFTTRHTFNPDGISYIEVGETWLRGDFRHAINGYWNPLYSICLALMAKLFPRYQEDVSDHAVNFLLFLLLQHLFFSLLDQFRRVLARERNDSQADFTLLCVACPLFAWTCFVLIDLSKITPDLMVACVFTAVATSMLRNYLDGPSWRTCLTIGFWLGIGYLAKTVVFLLAIPFLVFLGLAGRARKPTGLFALLSAGVFFAIAGPYIYFLSSTKGHVTYGESGLLAYAWEVNGVSPYFHWQGGPDDFGNALHPPNEISHNPPVFTFSDEVHSTYPLWFDPSYWNAGLHPRFVLVQQVQAILKALKVYCKMLVNPVNIAFIILIAIAARGRWCECLTRVAGFWWLILPALTPFALYALVYAETRYIGIFVLLIHLCCLTGVLISGGNISLSRTKQFGIVCVLTLFVICGRVAAQSQIGYLHRRYIAHLETAQFLNAHGVGNGDPIALMGQGVSAWFARLARTPIVAEASTFHFEPAWVREPSERERIAKMLETFGVRAIVIDQKVEKLDRTKWNLMPCGEMAVRLLPQASSGTPAR